MEVVRPDAQGDRDPVETAVAEMLKALDVPLNDEVHKNTPHRVARAMREMTAGYGVDPAKLLGRSFEADDYDEIVVVTGIAFTSLCEHHLLPFTGTASVAYIPHERVVGLSKLARVVQCVARRFQLQERMTVQIADAINTALTPLGVAVVVEAEHLCMAARGVRAPGTLTVTSRMVGAFREKPAARAEVMKLLGRQA